VLPDLLGQIPSDQPPGIVTADVAYDSRACHAAIAARGAAAVIPPRRNGKPWTEQTAAATARNEALRRCRCLGRAIWKRWTGYHRRSLAEAKMRCLNLLGKRVMSRDFDRQGAELQIRQPSSTASPPSDHRSPSAQDRSVQGKGYSGLHPICTTCVTAPCARGIFRAAFGASPGADMCPASVAAIFTPRTRMVFEGEASNATGSREMPNGQIKATCSVALCCTLVLPSPSHDCCAKLLLALFRSDVLATADDLRRGRRPVDAALGHLGPDDPCVRGSLEPVALTAHCWPAPRAPASAASSPACRPAKCPAGPRHGPAA
jgi:hypothetical protein